MRAGQVKQTDVMCMQQVYSAQALKLAGGLTTVHTSTA